MKKLYRTNSLLIILMAVILVGVFTLSACGKTASPSDVVKAELDSAKTTSGEEVAAAFGEDEITFSEDFTKQLEDFSYKIEGEEIDGDDAIVTVTIKTYDFGTAFETAAESVLDDVIEKVISGADVDESQLLQNIFDVFFAEAKSAEKDYSETVEIYFTKTDGEWEIDEDDSEELYNAIYGDLFSAIEMFDIATYLEDALSLYTDYFDALDDLW